VLPKRKIIDLGKSYLGQNSSTSGGVLKKKTDTNRGSVLPKKLSGEGLEWKRRRLSDRAVMVSQQRLWSRAGE